MSLRWDDENKRIWFQSTPTFGCWIYPDRKTLKMLEQVKKKCFLIKYYYTKSKCWSTNLAGYFYALDEETAKKDLLEDLSKLEDVEEISIISCVERNYVVLTENVASDLEDKVNKFLKNGWQLSGGVSIGYGGTDQRDPKRIYTQSLWRN